MPVSVSEKWHSLVSKLMKLTNQNSLVWEAKADGYKSRISDRLISVHKYHDFDGEISIVFSVLKTEDWGEEVTIDTFNDDDLTNIGYDELNDFFRSIQRKASGADKELDDLLSDLDAIDSDF